MGKVLLELTERQARVLQNAAEEYMRLRMGQMDLWIDRVARYPKRAEGETDREHDAKFREFHARHRAAESLMLEAWRVLTKGESMEYARTDEVNICHDLYEVIRHGFWKRGADRSFLTVDSSEPLHWCKAEPLPKMRFLEVVEELERFLAEMRPATKEESDSVARIVRSLSNGKGEKDESI